MARYYAEEINFSHIIDNSKWLKSLLLSLSLKQLALIKLLNIIDYVYFSGFFVAFAYKKLNLLLISYLGFLDYFVFGVIVSQVLGFFSGGRAGVQPEGAAPRGGRRPHPPQLCVGAHPPHLQADTRGEGCHPAPPQRWWNTG